MKKNFLLMMLLSTISVLTVAIFLTGPINAQENTTDSNTPKFFAIQHAQSGSISEINASAYNLELTELSDKTILFSDRPDRIVKTESTTNFIGNWSIGVDSFAIDAPNAVLVVDEIEGQQDVAIIELFNPVYDFNNKTLKYVVTPDNATSIELPSEFGQATMIIDMFNDKHVEAGPTGVIPIAVLKEESTIVEI